MHGLRAALLEVEKMASLLTAGPAPRATVAICPPAIVGAAGFDSWIADRLAGFAVRVQIEVAAPEPGALRARIVGLNCRVLGIEAGALGELDELTRWLTCDLLVVR